MGKTKIEWADETWNPLAGCNDVSEGCRHCYARTMAHRLELMGQEKYKGLTVMQGSHVVWTGKISFDEKALLAPLTKNKPTRYFVNSMSDLFHPNVTDEQVDRIFAVMALCSQHTFMVLTKRPERMLAYLQQVLGEKDIKRWINAAYDAVPHLSPCAAGMMEDIEWPLPNVWLGTSVEDQSAADKRIQFLLQTPAAIRFLSCEPLLGPVDLSIVPRPFEFHQSPYGWHNWWPKKLHWIIAGGESGSDARPMHFAWVRSLRDQCVAAGVPFFFKQWGEWSPDCPDFHKVSDKRYSHKTFAWGKDGEKYNPLRPEPDNFPQMVYRVGKKAAGHMLDGREWLEFPKP